MSPDGLPHSETCGSKVICTLPQLIAAYRVLHRLREPRHPPCALSYFLVSISSLLSCAAQAVAHKGQGRRGHFKSCICHTMSKIVLALKRPAVENNGVEPKRTLPGTDAASFPPKNITEAIQTPALPALQLETLFPIADAKVQLFSINPNLERVFFLPPPSFGN